MARVGRLIAASVVAVAGSEASASFDLSGIAALAPSVAVTAPTAGAYLAGIVTVTAIRTSKFETPPANFVIDKTPIATLSTASPWSAPWDTRTWPNGSHTVAVQLGSGQHATVIVNVANPYCQDDYNPCTGTPFVGPDGKCVSPLAPPGTVMCRPAAGLCDVPEFCDGWLPSCPPDVFASTSTSCRAPADGCDTPEYCSGGAVDCPVDGPRLTACNSARRFYPLNVASDLAVAELKRLDPQLSGPSGESRYPSTISFVTEPLRARASISGTVTALSLACTGSCYHGIAVYRRTQGGTLGYICSATQQPYSSGCTVSNPVDVLPDERIQLDVTLFEPSPEGSALAFSFGVEQSWVEFLQDVPLRWCGTEPAPGPCVEWVCRDAGWEATPASPGALCRASRGECDTAEYCDGVTMSCPPDLFAQPYEDCRPPSGVCDAAERCTGIDPACPSDDLLVGNVCRPDSGGGCDVAEVCDGSAPTCPSDTYRPVGAECRVSAGPCDVVDVCTGASGTCPADELKPSSEECRPAAGYCDVAEFCDGTLPSCPSDLFASTSVVCRPAVGECDLPEYCSETAADCPVDASAAAGLPCSGRSGCVCDANKECIRNEALTNYCYDGAGNMTARIVTPAGMACATSGVSCP